MFPRRDNNSYILDNKIDKGIDERHTAGLRDRNQKGNKWTNIVYHRTQ